MRLGHDLLQFRRAHRLRQLLNSAPRPPLFLFRQLGPSAFLETLDRILPLFHLFANYRDGIGIGERKGSVSTILFALF